LCLGSAVAVSDQLHQAHRRRVRWRSLTEATEWCFGVACVFGVARGDVASGYPRKPTVPSQRTMAVSATQIGLGTHSPGYTVGLFLLFYRVHRTPQSILLLFSPKIGNGKNTTKSSVCFGGRPEPKCAGDVRASLRRANGRRGALHFEHAARRRHAVRSAGPLGRQPRCSSSSRASSTSGETR
jgi:hypothetical protein